MTPSRPQPLAEMIVIEVQNEGDRVLFFRDSSYHVIAKPEEAVDVAAGDTIVYEPYGLNFGWFKEKQARRNDERNQKS